jgi:alkylation response protein AidB-like acyl-CoA dehydrogenase
VVRGLFDADLGALVAMSEERKDGCMTDVCLTKEERAFQEEVAEFVTRQIAPRAEEIDRQDRVPDEVFEALNAYTTLTYPQEYGGSGKGETYACIVVEEVGAACPALVPYLEVAQLFGIAVLLDGREDQKQRYLTRLADGKVGAYALTDEGPGSDAAHLTTTATRAGGGYRLRGKKRNITFFDLAEFLVVFASSEQGVTAFLLDAPWQGIDVVRRSEWIGLRGHKAWDFTLDVEVPESQRLGAEGQGLKLALEVLNHSRISLAAGHCGLARSALGLAQQFAIEREVGGRPLWKNQAVGFAIVEAQARVEAARLLAYRAARMSEQGMMHRRETAQAKFFAAEALLGAVDVGNRVLGGFSGHRDTPAERYLRDAYSWVAAQGTIEVQKLTVAMETFARRGPAARA